MLNLQIHWAKHNTLDALQRWHNLPSSCDGVTQENLNLPEPVLNTSSTFLIPAETAFLVTDLKRVLPSSAHLCDLETILTADIVAGIRNDSTLNSPSSNHCSLKTPLLLRISIHVPQVG